MRHRKKKLKLKVSSQYRKALLRNLATSIILYEKVKTTKTKANAVAPLIEKLINIAKQAQKKEQEMNVIRKLNQIVFDKNASKKLLEDLKKRYSEKRSGYVRIMNLGTRKGDAAPMVQVELV